MSRFVNKRPLLALDNSACECSLFLSPISTCYVLLDKIPLIPGRLAPDSVQFSGKCCFLHCFPSSVESSTLLEDWNCCSQSSAGHYWRHCRQLGPVVCGLGDFKTQVCIWCNWVEQSLQDCSVLHCWRRAPKHFVAVSVALKASCLVVCMPIAKWKVIKHKKVAASSPSVGTEWRLLPEVDGNIFFLRKNSEGFLWDSLVLVWNVSLAADWVDWQGRVGSKAEHSLKWRDLLSVSRLLGALSVFHPTHLSLWLVSLCPWSDPAVHGDVQGELRIVSQHLRLSLCNMVKWGTA